MTRQFERYSAYTPMPTTTTASAMTDNRTTELLREGLTKRGIEWRSGLEGVTFVGDWCFVEYDNGKLAATCEPVLTPEQAIAATLCKPMKKDLRQALDFMRIWISDDAHLGESELSYEFEKAEGLRKLEAIEQAIAATLGSGALAIEQIKDAVLKNFHYDRLKPPLFDWQAIADELNAELVSGTCYIVKTPSDSDFSDDWRYRCSECGCNIPVNERDPETGDVINAANFCPNCGRKVVSE